jgi:hypothetical protein
MDSRRFPAYLGVNTMEFFPLGHYIVLSWLSYLDTDCKYSFQSVIVVKTLSETCDGEEENPLEEFLIIARVSEI